MTSLIDQAWVILKEDEDFMDDEFNTAASSFQDDNSAEQDLAALLKMVRWYCHFVVEDAKHPLLGFADEISQRHGGI